MPLRSRHQWLYPEEDHSMICRPCFVEEAVHREDEGLEYDGPFDVVEGRAP